MKVQTVAAFLLANLLVCSCATRAAVPPRPAPTPAPATGEGSSFETAVVIQAESEDTGVAAEYAWLKQHYPGYRTRRQALASHKEKPYDLITIVTVSGEEKTVYFDISRFFGKW